MMLIAGVAEVINAFALKSWGNFLLWLALGLLYIVAGFVTFENPLLAAALLTLMLGVALVASGIMRIVLAISMRGSVPWIWVVFSGAITLLLGIVITARIGPCPSLYVLGMFLGIDLVFAGVGWILVGSGLKGRAIAPMVEYCTICIAEQQAKRAAIEGDSAMRRRVFLVGGSAAAAGAAIRPAASQSPPAAGQPLAPTDIEAAVARLRKQFRAQFDPAYVENVIVPYFLVSTYQGERLSLPMIDVKLTKENALPYDLWGLISETLERPAPRTYGVTVFLQGLEKRGLEQSP